MVESSADAKRPQWLTVNRGRKGKLGHYPPASNLAELRLLGYDAQALTITAVRHLLILFADLLAAISMVGLFVILCLIFQGARAVAAVETEPSPTLSCGPELRP